jgi:hypothetical protein
MEILLNNEFSKLKQEILDEVLPYLKKLTDEKPDEKPKEKWLKSKEVRKLLGISAGTLNSLKSQIKNTKVKGTLYWSADSIQELMERNIQN